MRLLPPQLKFLAITAFYVGLNAMPLILLGALYLIYTGSMIGIVIVLLCVVDYALPLPTPGIQQWWCRLTDESEGKCAYFPAEVAIETQFNKHTNYLVTTL